MKAVLPFFSIIIPTYNSAKTLSVCFESMLNQTFQGFEILIIDGCSSDNTIEIVEKYELFNLTIKCISKKDKGIYDAMNKGIKLAKGEWLYFLGSDDNFFSNDVLFKISDFIKNDAKIDVIYGDVYSPRFNGIYDGEFNTDKIFSKNICHQAIFFKKCVFNKIGLYNLKFKVHADWDHNIRWFQFRKINKKYVNIICANYADGGYSSTNIEDTFIATKGWDYFINKHEKLSYGYKFLIIKVEIKKSFRDNNYYKLLRILFQTPIFLKS